MVVLLQRIFAISKKYPLLRGMMAYSVLWPSSNICQQKLHGREQISFSEAARFSIFGTLYVAPTLYTWVRISSFLFPGNSIKVAVKKVLCEQFTYGPFAVTSFYMGMSLLEGKTLEGAVEEVKHKFWHTLRTGLCFWPVVQTVNFAFVPERNRVAVSACASFFWGIFLSYMKHKKTLNSSGGKQNGDM